MVWNSREDEAALYDGHDHSADHDDVPETSRRRSHKCIVIFLSVALVAVLVAIILPVTLNLQNRNGDTTAPQPSASPSAVTAACAASQYPETCSETLQNSTKANAKVFTQTTLLAAQDGVESVRLQVQESATPENAAAVKVCLEVLQTADAELSAVLEALNGTDPAAVRAAFDDMKVRLTAAMEFHTTCVDALEEVGGDVSAAVRAVCKKTNEVFSVALSFLSLYSGVGENFWAWARAAGYGGQRRRLLGDDGEDESVEEIPRWVGVERRRHLLATTPGSYINVTVAWNGSGRFKKIMQAVDAAPKKSDKLYVIYIKAGTYKEQVIISNQHTNLMFLGDGAGKTIISVNISVALTPNMTTFNTPALIVSGKGFLAKKITVRNVAGPNGHQAVAMRVSADDCAFYQCTFDSFQDTLYAHSYRQYYRECEVLGTIDYVFGNGYAVFQKCTLIAKKSSIVGQINTYTAQGKTDINMKSGLSFQNCFFNATKDLNKNQKTFKTFLGRPWKEYSTAVLMKCTINAHVDPKGWLPWNTSDFGLATSYFAEHRSGGPGATAAIIKQRVPWSKQISAADANKYQFRYWAEPQFPTWVPATGFPYDLRL